MSYKFVYRSKVLSRAQLNSAELQFENGDQLVAIVPYSTSDDVTVITMKRVSIEVPTPLDINELNLDGVTLNAPAN